MTATSAHNAPKSADGEEVAPGLARLPDKAARTDALRRRVPSPTICPNCKVRCGSSSELGTHLKYFCRKLYGRTS